MKKIIIAMIMLSIGASGAIACSKCAAKAKAKKEGIITMSEEQLPIARQVKASHILVRTEDKALELKKEISTPEDFKKLAAEHSSCPSGAQGGDLGYFGRGMMVREFEEAAFSTPEGKVTEPVQTQFGWHLILVEDRK